MLTGMDGPDSFLTLEKTLSAFTAGSVSGGSVLYLRYVEVLSLHAHLTEFFHHKEILYLVKCFLCSIAMII